jgi:hypothetical protein
LIFIVIAGAMALPIFFKVYASDYLGFLITLRKYNSYVLGILRVAFYRVSWAGISLYIAFAVVDAAVFHDVLHFRFCYFPALHAAAGVFGVFKEGYTAVKAAVAVYFREFACGA